MVLVLILPDVAGSNKCSVPYVVRARARRARDEALALVTVFGAAHFSHLLRRT